MAEQSITPERITKPIQLLAAWLAGLVLIDGAFLAAASTLNRPDWAAGLLVVAAIVNVPIFIGALFLLQTRFRAEMQEDTYYSRYLERSFSGSVRSTETLDITAYSKQLASEIVEALGPGQPAKREPVEDVIRRSQIEDLARRLSGNRALSELYYRPQLWPELVQRWRENHKFREELTELRTNALIDIPGEVYEKATLTESGRTVASLQSQSQTTWRDMNKSFWEEEEIALTRGQAAEVSQPARMH